MAKTKVTARDINDELFSIMYEGVDVDDEGDLVIQPDSVLMHYAEIAHEGEEPITGIEQALDVLEMARDEKFEQCAYVILDKKALIAANKAEIKRIQGLNKVLENELKGVTNYLLGEVLRWGKKLFKGKFCTISARKSPTKAVIATDERDKPDPSKVDPRFTYEVTETKVDAKAAIAHNKETDEQVEGITFEKDNHHLIIK